MTKLVLDVGNCGPDFAAIKALVEDHFDATVVSADLPADALQAVCHQRPDLVLVNRKLDADYSDGLRVIEQIKADPQLADIPCMLVTNYEEHQRAAMAAGAERGFGKLQLQAPQTLKRLAAFLGPPQPPP
ncbi:MAG: response regulator [Planctomycetales bacterium]|nr:response regulator [Planctomycetales bacterium]NIM08837.1 response regulator [Planctomycetales bacterium]NIN08298.1 response regulator [Planctomycetales bacterium]NIN77427.1 response regulator [Planctomycetales bacterium]NIO34601.1 response regulator [Planctomycetales bacterium]